MLRVKKALMMKTTTGLPDAGISASSYVRVVQRCSMMPQPVPFFADSLVDIHEKTVNNRMGAWYWQRRASLDMVGRSEGERL